jgi:hypothetical protein
MSEFDDLQTQLAHAQKAAADAARKLFADRQLLERAKGKRRNAERVVTDPVHDGQLAEIDAEIAKRAAAVKTARADLEATRGAADARLRPFLDLTDPREHVGNLDDNTPILLMPLRIETRFRLADPDNNRDAQSELWVRVFPDDFAVDTFEETLSESELRRLKAYWTGIWAAGGVEADRRGAWKVFAGAVGSGRAHWLQSVYFPDGDPPLKVEGTPSVILAIPTEEALLEAERAPLAIFWEAHWRAGDNAAAQAAAAQVLTMALGDARADVLVQSHVPANLAVPSPEGTDPATVPVEVAFVVFPSTADMPIREYSWTSAPKVEIMPDRLVLIGYNQGEKTLERLGNPIPDSLVVAPEPDADADDQLKPEGPKNEDITLGAELEWIADFDKAVEIGMGFRIPLDSIAFRTGFDQLMVLGVRLKADAGAGKDALEYLITHHKQSRAGFELLPQGTPTNNVETEGAGYARKSDADISFDRYFGAPPDDLDGWFEKHDGRWLADTLGLPPALFSDVAGGRGYDIRDALAMNTLLWPATAGYFMDAMLDTVFETDTITDTRDFFVRHVSARGTVPVIRIGRQPYGILPATPRSRIGWMRPRHRDTSTTGVLPGDPNLPFLRRLYSLLQLVESDWRTLDSQVSWIGKPGAEQHQVLLDVLGLHPGSVEHYQRYAESFKQLYNRMRLEGAGGAFTAVITALAYTFSGQQLLERLGHVPGDNEGLPDILEKLFLRDPNLLTGGLVQDIPLSEAEPLRTYTETGENYLTWMMVAAGTSHDALRLQKGFDSGIPTALLYLMAHHALDLSFVEVSQLLLVQAGLITPEQRVARRREAQFLHVETPAIENPTEAVGSRWADLYRTEPVITGSANLTIGEHIPKILTTHVATAYLSRQLDALRRLEARPSAALERAFAEHLDLLSYRLDAWYGGIMSYQLERMRFGAGGSPDATETPPEDTSDTATTIDSDGDGLPDQPGQPDAPDQPGDAAQGLYLGAYGWLEDVRPEFKTLTEVDLPPALEKIFKRPGDVPPVTDNRNAGYIHAPSLNHAVTAAVLRNGYLSNATPQNPGSLAINLSSERVRLALQIIEGMEAGQSMGALLGYQFERGLHDRHDVEVDAFIYELRSAFPLASGRLKATRAPRTDELGLKVNIRKVEARNVLDGLELVEHMRDSGNKTYPFDKGDILPNATSTQRDAISDEADRIANIADATADLAMAESVHQVVQGNYDRAGATLDTFSKGKFPSTPDVIRTPRSGTGLTHRVGLHRATGLDPSTAPGARARSEPALNAWLAGQLPAPARVVCQIRLTDPDDNSETLVQVSQSDLGLSALDMLYLLDVDNQPSMRMLDDLVERHVIAAHTPRPDIGLSIGYLERLAAVPDHVPFFELAALIRPLRALLLDSRPLRPTDLALAQEADRATDAGPSLDPQRIILNRTALDAARTSLTGFHAPLAARIEAEETPQIVAEIDGNIDAFVSEMSNLAAFSDLRSGTGQVFEDRRKIFAGLRARLVEYTSRWTVRLDVFDTAIDDYDALPVATGDAERFLALQKAERLITLTPTDPLPVIPAAFRTDQDTRRAAFAAQLATLTALGTTQNTISGLVAGIEAEAAANATFMLDPIDIGPDTQAILALAQDMATRAAALITALTSRIDQIDAHLAEAAAASSGSAQVAALTAAAQAMFGETFQIVPEFTLPAEQAQELANAWGPGPTADDAILDHVQTTLGRPFAVDDWLHGIARVRKKMGEIEAAGTLAEAFGNGNLTLQPLQLPHRTGLPWLALDLPELDANGEPFAVDEDKLLYTAHYPATLNAGGPIAGLLLDEWTEVIPSRSEETGLAVHYDRPNSEAPQTLLLALPAEFTGAWDWPDLVDTVRETMDMARLRAIEPDQIDTTAYARFLPATVSAVTFKPITAMLNLAANNGLIAALVAQEGAND